MNNPDPFNLPPEEFERTLGLQQNEPTSSDPAAKPAATPHAIRCEYAAPKRC
jgi:hypothetical protein